MGIRERLEQVKSPLRDAVVVGPREGRQERWSAPGPSAFSIMPHQASARFAACAPVNATFETVRSTISWAPMA